MELILRFFSVLFLSLLLISCNNDDDICTAGEGTPRMKIKFKDSNNKLVRLNKLYIDADYGNGMKNIINKTSVDSVLLPLNVDGSGFTKLSIYADENASKSGLKINYTEESSYVSPACGVKKNYKNISAELTNPNIVKSLELNQKEIINENKTHLYLIF